MNDKRVAFYDDSYLTEKYGSSKQIKHLRCTHKNAVSIET